MTSRHPIRLCCKDVVELLTELLEHSLDPKSRAWIEQHLLVCPPCTIHLGQVRDTIALTGELLEPSPTPAAPELLAAFRKGGV